MRGAVAFSLFLLAACAQGSSHVVDGGMDLGRPDATTPPPDAAHETGAPDLAIDAARDLGSDPGVDAGMDAAVIDLGADAGHDAGTDAGLDLGPDLGRDLGPDLGPDLGLDAGPAMTITWGTSATAHGCPGSIGMRFDYVCPPGGAPSSLWGTGEYTYDSSICTAAVHGGRITLAAGGAVTIEMRAGRTSYTGTMRNGITSSTYGSYVCSYAVVLPACATPFAACDPDTCTNLSMDSANCGMCGMACVAPAVCAASSCGCPPGRTACGGTCVDTTNDVANCGICGHACAAGEVCGGSTCAGTIATWSTSATTHSCPADIGTRFSYVCPAGGAPGTAWGTDTYTHDSSICTAAVHVGRITLASGGAVTIQMAPGATSYTGSTRNGVTTLSYPSWTCSYTIP